jgi:glutamate formiminotransferase/glutamate formiminotransferase/formiminotetrahydrofolate cyclodeaminase
MQVLEARMEAVLTPAANFMAGHLPRKDLLRVSVSEFAEAVAAPTAVPAGAAVAALTGAFAAALGVMAARLSRRPSAERPLEEIVRRLHHLLLADGAAYNTFVAATKLPETEPGRPIAVSSALHVATEIPLEMAERSLEAATLLAASSNAAKPRLRSDVQVGLILAVAAAQACLHTTKENMKGQVNQRLRESLMSRLQTVSQNVEELRALCYTPPPGRSGKHSVQASPGKAQTRDEWKSKSSTTMSRRPSKSRRKNWREKGSSEN